MSSREFGDNCQLPALDETGEMLAGRMQRRRRILRSASCERSGGFAKLNAH